MSPATGQRLVTINGPCILSLAPSPAGVTCVEMGTNTARIIDWTGLATSVAAYSSSGLSGLSPSGDKLFYMYSPGSGVIGSTSIVRRNSGVSTPVNEHEACGWIDHDHVLATDAVIDASIGEMGFPTGRVTPLGHIGVCAGRVPGEL